MTIEDIYPTEVEDFRCLNIADTPIIGIDDIITYNNLIHELQLTDSAYDRISQLEIPVRGKAFLVCVDRKPIYWGAFWTPISSMSFNGVTIWKPLSTQKSKIITLELGYPSAAFYNGKDPRNNSEVIKALEQADKLINKLPITSLGKLPHSVKGYELYSWEEDEQWHFTLITGTNRNKMLEEIISKEEDITESGWVKIHVISVPAIEDVLGRLPQREFVIWYDETILMQTGEIDISLQLPPEQIIDAVKVYAERFGLDFTVMTSIKQ